MQQDFYRVLKRALVTMDNVRAAIDFVLIAGSCSVEGKRKKSENP